MSKPRYLVTHVPHFIGGRMVYPGMGNDSIVTLPDGVEPGRWLVLADAGAVALADAGPMYSARHVGGGNWVVERVADGARVASFGKTDGDAKALAAVEADRLNAGGAVIPVSTDAAPSSGQDDPAAGASGSELPDA